MKSVITTLQGLLNQIKIDQTIRIKIDEPIEFNVSSISNNPDQLN